MILLIVDISNGKVIPFGIKFSILYGIREPGKFVCLGIHDDGETANKVLENYKNSIAIAIANSSSSSSSSSSSDMMRNDKIAIWNVELNLNLNHKRNGKYKPKGVIYY